VFLLFFPSLLLPPRLLPPFPSPSLTFPWQHYPLPRLTLSLEVGALNQLGGLVSAVSFPSGVRGGAPAEIEFGAL